MISLEGCWTRYWSRYSCHCTFLIIVRREDKQNGDRVAHKACIPHNLKLKAANSANSAILIWLFWLTHRRLFKIKEACHNRDHVRTRPQTSSPYSSQCTVPIPSPSSIHSINIIHPIKLKLSIWQNLTPSDNVVLHTESPSTSPI